MKNLVKIKNLWLLCFFLILASCTKTEPSIPEIPETQPSEQKATVSQTQNISIAQMKFGPNHISTKVGDTLIFTNNDIVAHNVTQVPDAKWASPLLQPGESWTFVPTQSDSLYCSIHPTMKGYIEIK